MPYNVFVDESGTSGAPHEPVAAVAAVIIPQASTQRAYDAVRAINSTAPAHFRKDFVFHATDLLNRGGGYADRWPRKERLAMVHAMMRLPSALQLAVMWTAVRVTHPIKVDPNFPISEPDMRHLMAFAQCIGWVNRYLTDRNDTGVLVVEQTPTMQERLNYAFYQLRKIPLTLDVSPGEKPLDGSSWETEKQPVEFRADRISEPPAFLPKEYPLLQIADACAFGIRSYLTPTKHGESYLQKINGGASLPSWYQAARDQTFVSGLLQWPSD